LIEKHIGLPEWKILAIPLRGPIVLHVLPLGGFIHCNLKPALMIKNTTHTRTHDIQFFGLYLYIFRGMGPFEKNPTARST
jgi:hypothetical protein